jgi:hypothetical protein
MLSYEELRELLAMAEDQPERQENQKPPATL